MKSIAALLSITALSLLGCGSTPSSNVAYKPQDSLEAIQFYQRSGLLNSFGSNGSPKVLVGFSPFKIGNLYLFKNNIWGIRATQAPNSLPLDSIQQLLYVSGISEELSTIEADKLELLKAIRRVLIEHGSVFLTTKFQGDLKGLLTSREVSSRECTSFRSGEKLVNNDYKSPTLFCESLSGSKSLITYLTVPNQNSYQITYHNKNNKGRLQISYLENGTYQKPIVLDGV